MTWRDSTTVSDRIFASLPYLLPLIDGLDFGTFLFKQFPILQIILQPILPLLILYGSIPFAGLIIFFALYLGVVRNSNINYFIRFNTMQAILLDIGLILLSLIVPILARVLPSPIIGETLYNTVFLGVVVAFFYSVIQSLLGRYAEIPTISDAVKMQVR